jgi:UDP-N-acetylmuramoylalanine--D-glutamate ligase
MKWKEFFKDKKVTQMGLGLLGRGVGDAKFLSEYCAELIVTDMKTKEELAHSLDQLSSCKNITYRLGHHELEDFQDRDFILKGAGVALDSLFIEHARDNDIPIEMDESLFAKLAQDVTIIGVTGTRGKTTVATLIHHILESCGKKSHLAGNVRGVATLPLLSKIKKGDYVVMELSSWQLQGFGESRISPHVSVFTTFLDDHLNYYGGSRDLYFYDKSHIFRHQKKDDILIVGPQAESFVRDVVNIQSVIRVAHTSHVPNDFVLPIPGEHNKENIACALLAVESLGISIPDQKKGVESFRAVPGRLEFVKEIHGIPVYNDNNATTADATVVALRSVGDVSVDHANIILIAGGADKGLAMKKLHTEIESKCKFVVFLDGTGTKEFLEKHPLAVSHIIVSSMADAVANAFEKTTAGDVILFSPAFASFGMFKNEYDRNDQFIHEIEKLN